MRVIAGLRKGHNLLAPPGREVRPTSDRVRTVLFDILGEFVSSARVLDLFAGAGTLGIEALSRGAASADFVDSHQAHTQLIQENLRRTHLEHHGRVILADAFVFLAQPHAAPYQLICADPPYRFAQTEKLFALIESNNWLAENGRLVWETSIHNATLQSGNVLELVRERSLGDTVLRFYQTRRRE
ncbi:MAG: 16S rRNA (guanine(966)-N(2))-methyltransferase RsmD [candidate division KSB1 bacterium]